MKKEDLLNDEFLKQFKNSSDFDGFMDKLYKRGVEKMLEGELDAHLGYDKNKVNDSSNTRNVIWYRPIKTAHGKAEIKAPRDREASFKPVLSHIVCLLFLASNAYFHLF